MHFGENQLSRSLIGLSPLPTAHPLSFQPKWVRSSTRSYPRFNLAMGRSLRFGSRSRDSFALFRLAFATASPRRVNLATYHNSQAHSSKGTRSLHFSPKADTLPRLEGTRVDRKSVVEGTWGSETSQYPQEEKATAIPLVVASESG